VESIPGTGYIDCVGSRYFRIDWRHRRTEDPTAIWYDVSESGAVERLIETYEDGRVRCEAIEDYGGRERDLPGTGSLIPEHWERAAEGLTEQAADAEPVSLCPVAAKEFQKVWRQHRGTDRS
jgi:hypothetical protein